MIRMSGGLVAVALVAGWATATSAEAQTFPSTLTVAWNRSTAPVDRYDCYLDGVLKATVPGDQQTCQLPVQPGAHVIRVYGDLLAPAVITVTLPPPVPTQVKMK